MWKPYNVTRLSFLQRMYMNQVTTYQQESLTQVLKDIDRNWTAKDEADADKCQYCLSDDIISYDDLLITKCLTCGITF